MRTEEYYQNLLRQSYFEAKEAGVKEGLRISRKQIASQAKKEGYSIAEIARLMNISEEEVAQILSH